MRKRNQKYNNKKVVRGGVEFDSKKEARFYAQLKRMEAEGLIRDLEKEPEYILIPRTVIVKKGVKRINRVTRFFPDFRFFDIEQNRVRVVDAKGVRTTAYLLKKKLFDYQHLAEGLYIEETI